jgi:general secretion pathway protein L
MSLLAVIGALLDDWVAAVAAAVQSVVGRVRPRGEFLLIEGDDGSFTARGSRIGKDGGLPETAFRVIAGLPSPALPPEWVNALRGSRVEFQMNPDQMLFRVVEFPRQATEFLDGMIRAQIDRLTPWSSHEAAFGWSEPNAIAGDRVQLTVAATSKRSIEPLVTLGQKLGARDVAGVVEHRLNTGQVNRIKVFDLPIQGAAGSTINLLRALRLGLLGAAAAAAASLAVATYLVNNLDLERQQLQNQIAQRRTALRLDQDGAAGSAHALLVKRKQTTPATVMVLESISKALPDGTYVTELRIEGDKVQIVGMTQDAPPLIRLIEQSPQFTRATFFAPTTRTQNESGEGFHIEANLKPFFGSAP